MTHYLSANDILNIHSQLVKMFVLEADPISPPGPRDLTLVHSASMRPQTSLGHTEKYKTVEAKAAAFLHSLITNHPFHNGNKRTGLFTTVVFLDRNDRMLRATDDECFDLVVGIAGKTSPFNGTADEVVKEIEGWFRQHVYVARTAPRGMRTKEFLDSCQKCGCKVNKRRDGSGWQVLGRNGRSVKIGGDTRQINGIVVVRWLQDLGLSRGSTGMYFDEFRHGLNPEQELIVKFRAVLRRLAHA
jgi:death-on-curing family protein